MSDIYVSKAKREELEKRMQALGIQDDDLTEKFILGSGSGGQKRNKTASCVYLKHGPTGIAVKCQRSRSRELNRFHARRELCEQLTERIEGEKSRRQQEQEKIRRQKRRRSRRAKERMLKDKHIQSKKKSLRKQVDAGGE
jgi:protein subunit release factor B